jgi:hypothetical protein
VIERIVQQNVVTKPHERTKMRVRRADNEPRVVTCLTLVSLGVLLFSALLQTHNGFFDVPGSKECESSIDNNEWKRAHVPENATIRTQ